MAPAAAVTVVQEKEAIDQLDLNGLLLLVEKVFSEAIRREISDAEYIDMSLHIEQFLENPNCTAKIMNRLLEGIKELSFFREQRFCLSELKQLQLLKFEEFMMFKLLDVTDSASSNEEVYEAEVSIGSLRSLVRYLEHAPESLHSNIEYSLVKLNFGKFIKTIAEQLRVELYLYRKGTRSSHGMFTVMKLTRIFVMRTPEIYKKSFLNLHRRPEGILRCLSLFTIDRVRGDADLILMTVNTIVKEIVHPSNFIDFTNVQPVLEAFFEEIAQLLALLTPEEFRINSKNIFRSLRVLWNSPSSYRSVSCIGLFQRPPLLDLLRKEVNNGAAPDLKPLLYKYMRDFSPRHFRLRRTCHIVHARFYLHGLTDEERDEYMTIYVRELQLAMTLKETKHQNMSRKAGMLEFLLHEEFQAFFLPAVIDKYDGFRQVLEEVRDSAPFSGYNDKARRKLIHNLDQQQLQQIIGEHKFISTMCDKVLTSIENHRLVQNLSFLELNLGIMVS